MIDFDKTNEELIDECFHGMGGIVNDDIKGFMNNRLSVIYIDDVDAYDELCVSFDADELKQEIGADKVLIDGKFVGNVRFEDIKPVPSDFTGNGKFSRDVIAFEMDNKKIIDDMVGIPESVTFYEPSVYAEPYSYCYFWDPETLFNEEQRNEIIEMCRAHKDYFDMIEAMKNEPTA